jgi:MYXO-CTERM domain-containing protein
MKLSALAAGVISLSLAGTACDRGRELDTTDNRFDETTAPTGTTGIAPAEEAEPASAQALPDTASPLALMGGLGVLALAGAAGIRLVRRR